jgi:hypothetical protein
MDGDDEMVPHRLEYILKAFQDTKADFVLHSFVELKAPYQTKPTPESKYSTYRCLKNPFTVNTAMYAGLEVSPTLPPIHNGHLSLLSPIFKTHQYGDFIVTLPNKSYGWEDTEFNRRLYLNSYTGAFIPCQISLYHSYPK